MSVNNTIEVIRCGSTITRYKFILNKLHERPRIYIYGPIK